MEMGALTATPTVPSMFKPSFSEHHLSLLPHRRLPCKKRQPIAPVARLFGPAIVEASKLKVLFLSVDENGHPGKLPRTYTLTHCDITSRLALAFSQTINNCQSQLFKEQIEKLSEEEKRLLEEDSKSSKQ